MKRPPRPEPEFRDPRVIIAGPRSELRARIARLLADLGVDQVEVDVLTGGSQPPLRAGDLDELLDLLGLLELREGRGRPGLIGIGPGAEAVLRAASELPGAAKAVVGIAARSGGWMRGLGGITIPSLLIAPSEDRSLRRASRRVRRRLGLRGDVIAVAEARMAALASAWVEHHLSPSASSALRLRSASQAGPCLAKRVAAGLAPAAVLGLGSLAVPAAASTACDTNLEQGILEIACDDPKRAEIHLSTEKDRILLNGEPIDGATLHEVDLIKIRSGFGHDELKIDESAAFLGPGATQEDDGISEIELEIDLGDGDDTIRLLGDNKSEGNVYKLGRLGVDAGGDGDLDHKIVGAEMFLLDGQGGDDVLDASGSEATGDAFPFGLKMLGGDGDDVLIGGSADDVLDGGLGSNKLDGGDGFDTVKLAGDADHKLTDDVLGIKIGETEFLNKLHKIEAAHLVGGDSSNLLDASAFSGPVMLDGSFGDDILLPPLTPATPPGVPIPYPNIALGGDGFDTIKLAGDADYKLTDDVLEIKIGETEFLNKLHKIEGAHLTGGDSSNTFDANRWGSTPGSPVYSEIQVKGAGGDDLMLLGTTSKAVLDGGEGFDTIKLAGDADYKLTDDLLQIKIGDVEVENRLAKIEIGYLTGGPSANVLDGGASTGIKLTLEGLGGDDVLIGGALSDVLDGGDGIDGVQVGGSGHLKLGDDGALSGDDISDIFIKIESAMAKGTAGNDVLDASLAHKIKIELEGLSGDDLLIGGFNEAVLDGGDGFDTIKLAGDADYKLTDDALGIKIGDTEFLNKLHKIEGAHLVGGESANLLDGGASTGIKLTLEGLGGDDVLIGGALSDVLDGGDGIDRVQMGGGYLKLGDDGALSGGDISDIFIKIESAAAQGTEGDDVLDASLAHKIEIELEGLGGDDLLIGGFNKAVLDGGDGFDTIKLAGDADYKLTDDALGIKIGGSELENKLHKIEAAHLIGGETANKIDGSAAIKVELTLQGLAGDDTILGGALDDVVTGGLGDDILRGGDGIDLLFESGDVDFKFRTDEGHKLYGSSVDSVEGFEDLKLVGGESSNRIDARHWTFGAVIIDGGAGDDWIWGGALSDLLDGGQGNDRIHGREGGDTILGGEGDDDLRGEHGDDTLDGGPGFDLLDGGHEHDTCIHGEDVKHCE